MADPAQKKKGNKITAALRRPQVLEMRRAGLSVRRVAEHFDVSPATIVKDVKICMAELREQQHQSAEEYRAAIVDRVEYTISILWSRVRAGDLAAIAELRKQDAELARLTGAYAPTYSPVLPPAGEDEKGSDQYVSAWRAAQSARMAEAGQVLLSFSQALAVAPPIDADRAKE